MAKHNPVAENILLRRELANAYQQIDLMKAFTIRQCMEVAMITLHRDFGFGQDRCTDFHEKAMDNFVELAKLVIEDGKDDETVQWSLERFDRLVKEACGETRPFAVRYAQDQLYSRDKIEKEMAK